MNPNQNIRAIETCDLSALKGIIAANGLFPADMLDGMLAEHLGNHGSEALWFTLDQDGPQTIGFAAPEPMTSGTWNLYLLATHPDHQGNGFGKAMMVYLEATLISKSVRLLLVETSGLPDFGQARRFYKTCGFDQVATIPEFYDAGEDKIVFAKRLPSP